MHDPTMEEKVAGATFRELYAVMKPLDKWLVRITVVYALLGFIVGIIYGLFLLR